MARSTLEVVNSRAAALSRASAPTGTAPGSGSAAEQALAGLQGGLRLLRALAVAMAEAGVLPAVAEAAVASLGRAVTALGALPAESQGAPAAAAAAVEAAAIAADLVTGYPTLLDQHTELLPALSRCAGAGEALTRCIRAYLACVPAAALEARAAAAAASSAVHEVQAWPVPSIVADLIVVLYIFKPACSKQPCNHQTALQGSGLLSISFTKIPARVVQLQILPTWKIQGLEKH